MVELGKSKTAKRAKPESIDTITDQEVLHRMIRESISRGKRQRIKKRLAHLRGETVVADEAPTQKKESTLAAASGPSSSSAKQASVQ